MAPRVFLFCVLSAVGLLVWRSVGVAGQEVTLEFTLEPQDVVAVRSKPVILQCAVSSSVPGPVNISWTHYDRILPLVNDTRRYLLANGSLYIKKVLWKRNGSVQDGSTDQGLYRCMARNSVGALISRSARLHIATLAHDFFEIPKDTTTEEDGIVRFMCQIESVPKAMISWERNGKPLPHNGRYFMLDSGVLYITKVQLSDAGTFRCIATNLLTKKSRYSPEGHLEVSPKSQFRHVPEVISVTRPVIEAQSGENVTLDCAAGGSPIPELTWTFLPRIPGSKGRPLANTSRNGLNVVTLHHVTPDHAGTYTCTASVAPDKRTDTVMQTMSLEVLEVPSFVKVPTSQVYFTAKTVRFECEVKDNRTTEVVWRKNGKLLQINGRIKQRPSELVLANTVTDDSGLYQCMARNKAGESWAAGRLMVNMSRFQPDPPQGLTCHVLSDSLVRLECKEPARSASNITAYTIHYLPTDGGTEQQEVSVNCSFLLQKLSAFTNYTFYVRAYSSKSASDQSKHTKCQTGEGVPQAAPQLVLKATSPTSLRATWMPLSKEKAQGVVTEYKVQWRREGQASSRVEQVKGDITDFTITGLHPGKRYQVRVLAATSKGWPIQADEFEWKVLEMPDGPVNVPEAPTVHLTVVNSTSIEVTWSLPSEHNYKPDGFTLYYRKQYNEKSGPIDLTANSTQYLLGNLEPDCGYEVTVQAYNSEGAGVLGLKTIHTLPLSGSADVTAIPLIGLEPPTNLEAEPTSPTSINLTWTAPQSSVNVSYYTVCYGVVQSSHTVDSSIYSFVSSTSQGVEVTCLKPYTLYEFKVRTHDHNNLYGPYSQTVECHTLEDVPSVVLDVQWKVLNSSTVRVSWKEPQHTNGMIKQYEISFVRGFAGAQENVHSVTVSNSKLSTEVTDLEPNTLYFVTVKALTRAGMGPPSDRVTVTIPVVSSPHIPTSQRPSSSHGQETDQHLGIVVGVTIGVSCIVVCFVAIVWRKRCVKSASREYGGATVGSGSHHINGNGCYREWDRSPASHTRIMAAPSENQEMDYFVAAVTTNIPCENNTDHLDTKGGYPNGQANGLKHPLLTIGRIPNGQASRDRYSVRIIENPQFSRGENVGSEQKLLLPVTKAHTSHSHSDLRSEEEIRLLADHHDPLCTIGGEEACLQPETNGGVSADNSQSDRGRTEDASAAEVQANNLDLDTTKVTNLDLSCDDSVLSEGGNDSSHQNQEHLNSQQHSPHHHYHSHHHHYPQQNNSSHDHHRLHHIDYITGTTTTRSQFHPPLYEQLPEVTTGSHPAELSPEAATAAASS